MGERIPQSTTIRIPLYAVLSSDHLSPATGKTIAITISQNGTAFGNPSGGATNASEIGNGWYYYDASTTDTGTLGPLIIHGAVATIDNIDIAYDVVKATNFGITALPDTAVTSNASLITSGTGTAQLALSSGHVSNVDTLTTYTGNTVQTGDSFALIGTAGVGLTNLGDSRIANLDATISSRLASASYTAPDNADITSIKTQTDKLAFSVANQVDANIKSVNGTTVTGDGSSGTPWGP